MCEKKLAFKQKLGTTITLFFCSSFWEGLHQDVQDKVRGELLSVLGPDRPIELDRDRERLPYCMAFLMEVFRWPLILKIMGLHWNYLWKSNCRFCSISGYGAPHQVKTCQITWLLWQKSFFNFCCTCNSLVPKISSCHCLLWDISNPAKKWVFYFTGWRHWPCSGGILHHSTQRWRLPWTEIHHARQR